MPEGVARAVAAEAAHLEDLERIVDDEEPESADAERERLTGWMVALVRSGTLEAAAVLLAQTDLEMKDRMPHRRTSSDASPAPETHLLDQTDVPPPDSRRAAALRWSRGRVPGSTTLPGSDPASRRQGHRRRSRQSRSVRGECATADSISMHNKPLASTAARSVYESCGGEAASAEQQQERSQSMPVRYGHQRADGEDEEDQC